MYGSSRRKRQINHNRTDETNVPSVKETKELGATEVAEKLQVSVRTVSRWVQMGILLPSSTTVGGHRRFHPVVVEHLRRQLEAGR